MYVRTETCVYVCMHVNMCECTLEARGPPVYRGCPHGLFSTLSLRQGLSLNLELANPAAGPEEQAPEIHLLSAFSALATSRHYQIQLL